MEISNDFMKTYEYIKYAIEDGTVEKFDDGIKEYWYATEKIKVNGKIFNERERVDYERTKQRAGF